MNAIILLIAGRDRSAENFMRERLPLGVKVSLDELKKAYCRRFNCDLIEVPVKEPPRTDLPVCVYDGKNVQRLPYALK